MNSAVINFKTDPQLKEDAQKTAEELGFNLTSILNAYLRQLVKTKTIFFSANMEIPNTYLQGLIKQADEDLKTGNHSPKFKTADDFISYLHKQTK